MVYKKVMGKVFSLRLTDETYAELEAIAKTRRCNTSELLRNFIRFGLLAFSGEVTDIRVMVKDGDEWKPVMLV